MNFDALMVTAFSLLSLVGSYYTFIQRSISYAIKHGIDPVFAIPDGLRRNPAFFHALPFIVWSLRIALFFFVYRENDAGIAIVVVIASWFAQLAIYSLYPHKVEDLEK